MTEYVLYLDESLSEDENFLSIGGFVIKTSDAVQIREKMNDVRKTIWDDEYIKINNPILHSTEINTIYNNRNNNNLRTYIKHNEYNVFIGKTHDEIKKIYTNMYSKLCIILKTMNIIVLGCVIDKAKYKYLYDKKHVDDYYHIALETIVENYIHFLDCANGVGSIIYEARNSPSRNDSSSPDVRMYNNFCAIKMANKGIPNITQKSMLFRLREFNFQRKSGDNLCLALADFIVYNMSKMQHICEIENRSEFMKKLYLKSYNGDYDISQKDIRDYFGIRVLPIDIVQLNNLKNQNKIMKRTIKNLRYDIKKMSKKNEILKKEKEELKKTIQEFKKSIDI